MTHLKLEKIPVLAADFDPGPNPLPPIRQLKSVPWPVEVGDDILVQDRKYFNYGCINPLLPYQIQDNYNRTRSSKLLDAYILENDSLRATFLPQFGGRLWSLIYKPKNRELLYVNPVIQPCNLAYRDAWLSGGIEWNTGLPAHSPFTSDKPFFAVLHEKNLTILRMYEWERITHAPFQVDFFLDPDLPLLNVRTKLINPHSKEIPGYWFSNIAVPEHPNHRVLAPAEMAYTFDYTPDRYAVKKAQIPIHNGIDVSYPTRIPQSNDFFFRLDDHQWPWITSLDENGGGLIQASTKKLIGRKLFVWGMGPGGRRWQEFLSIPGHPYVEIQAGFGRTQAECRPLPPNSQTQWLEVYGYIETDPNVIHGPDYRLACREVENALSKLTSLEQLEIRLQQTETIAQKRPEDIIQYGSGWGALERIAAGIKEDQDFAASGIVFPDDSVGQEQAPWLHLLETGSLPNQDPNQFICGYQTADYWKNLLETSVAEHTSASWNANYLLGMACFANNNPSMAEKQFLTAIQKTLNFLSWRMLAWIEYERDNHSGALENFKNAWNLAPNHPQLADEYIQMLTDTHNYTQGAVLLKSLPSEIQTRPRIQIQAARIAFALGDLERAEEIINRVELINIRECETTLSDMWFEIQTRKRAQELNIEANEKLRKEIKATLTPPYNIDFRMS